MSRFDRELDTLTQDEPCWLLLGTLLYEVVISQVRVLDGGTEGRTFTLYRVESDTLWIRERTIHRSELFRRPAERARLVEQLNEDSEELARLAREVEAEGEDES